MTNFKDFYDKPAILSLAQSTTFIVQQTLLPTIGVLSIFSNSQEVEEFSEEVASYTVSNEVLSSITEQIGEPKEHENEDEFVERATNVLREILKKKFKV